MALGRVRRLDHAGIDTLQFHGEESPEFCARFAPVVRWKAFRVRDRSSLDLLPAYLHLDAWLLDSFVPGQHGGSGTSFRWELAIEAKTAGQDRQELYTLLGRLNELVKAMPPFTGTEEERQMLADYLHSLQQGDR